MIKTRTGGGGHQGEEREMYVLMGGGTRIEKKEMGGGWRWRKGM
jgi:hypothetical protein